MRPVITLLLVVGILAGVYAYTNFASSVQPEKIEYKATYATGKYSVRLSRTFDCAANTDFGFDTAIGVEFKEDRVFHRSDKVLKSEPITFDLPDVEVGKNAVYVEANLPTDLALDFSAGFEQEESQSHAMKVEILKSNTVVAEKSFWIEPGLGSVAGTVTFSVGPKITDQHDHDH